jgi:hypothetical protein
MSDAQDKDQIIANLRREWIALHAQFRSFFQEASHLRSYLILYATTEDEGNRAHLDTELAREYPAIWQEVQEWRQKKETEG